MFVLQINWSFLSLSFFLRLVLCVPRKRSCMGGVFPFKHSNENKIQTYKQISLFLLAASIIDAPFRALGPIIKDCTLKIHLILAKLSQCSIYSFFSSACLPSSLRLLLTRKEASNSCQGTQLVAFPITIKVFSPC